MLFGNIDNVIELIPTIIYSKENKEFTRPIDEIEIKISIWSLDPAKDPKNNGFSISLYTFFWDLIKYDLK